MIKEWTNYLVTIKGYSRNTSSSYEKDVRAFACHMRTQRADARWSNITRSDIDIYIISMKEAGKKPATINRHLAAISSIYNYMKREGYDIENPARYESRQPIAERIPNTIPVEDIKKAISQVDQNMGLIIETLLTTGIRIQELLDMTPRDLRPQDNTIKIKGKGGKERLVYTTPENMSHLLNYTGPLSKFEPIFIWWTQRDIRAAMYNAFKGITTARQVSPHAIRHTYATEMAKAGMQAPTLQRLLGHTQLKTTQRYIDFGQLQGRDEYNRYTNQINSTL